MLQILLENTGFAEDFTEAHHIHNMQWCSVCCPQSTGTHVNHFANKLLTCAVCLLAASVVKQLQQCKNVCTLPLCVHIKHGESAVLWENIAYELDNENKGDLHLNKGAVAC